MGPDVLRAALTHGQVYVLTVQGLLFAVLSAVCVPAMIRRYAPPRAAVWAAGSAAAIAVAIVLFVVPKTNRIYYDEHIYQGVAQNLSDLGLAQMCNEGNVEYGRLQCARGEYMKQPPGFPFVLSVFYRALGVHEGIAHTMNAVTAGLFVMGVFLLGGVLLGDWRAATFGAVVAATTPEHLLWSHTAASEPSAALMIVMALLAAAWFIEEESTMAAAWMVAATAFAIQFRVESVLVVPLIALAIGLLKPIAYTRRLLWVSVLAGLVLCGPHLVHLFAVRGESWGAEGDRMGLQFVQTNLKPNIAYLLDNTRFPLLVAALAAAAALWKPSRASAVISVTWALFFGVYLVFYAGSYEYGADIRYALMSHAPLAILAGLGISHLRRLAGRQGQPAGLVDGVILCALVVQFLAFMPLIRAVGEEAWAARTDVRFAEEVTPHLGRGSIVLTHNPAVFHLKGISAAQLGLVITDGPYVASALPARYAGGVVVHWNYWCNATGTTHPTLCTDVLQRFPHTLIREHRERDQRFAFYRLSTPAVPLLPLIRRLREP